MHGHEDVEQRLEAALVQVAREVVVDAPSVYPPRRLRNAGSETARLLLTFAPAGIERWFEETLEPAPNDVTDDDVPDNVEAVAARYAATAHRYGIEFV